MLLYENKKAKLLSILKIGINPFKKFVSTGEIKEDLGLVKSRESILQNIVDIIKEEDNFILPIIGDVGIGKTHLFWTLKNSLYYYNTIYISLDTVYKKFFYSTYSEFIDAIGVEPLRFIVNQLCDEWGALDRIYGFFHVADIEKVKKIAIQKLENKYDRDEKEALIDVINGIVTHQLDPFKKIEAEGWLLGELMNVRELSRLKLKFDLRKGKNAYIMLKLLIENSKLGSVLFIDDFEKIISITNPIDDETDEVFDPSWLYGQSQNPEEISSQKLLQKIIKLQSIKGLHLIITLKSDRSLEEIKERFQELSKEKTIKFIEPIYIENFTEDDIDDFYLKSMKYFLENLGLTKLAKAEFEYYPLNKQILRKLYSSTNGNPREIIKHLIKIFNDIIFSNNNLNAILREYESEQL
ncbi:MAG: hypothetical protein KGD73_11390 [Candidatus Lokiarchaeota archaeon]|nr:hypothetical protein [Candidatus Lokiarchaeota archaeon]